MSWQSEWVERHLKREMTEFQHDAVTLICEAMRCGPYDFAGTFRRAIWEYGKGVSFVVRSYFATYDCDGLTRLVVGAHDRCIRVEVEGCGPKMLRVSMWPRNGREGRLYERHPTLEQAAASIRPKPEAESPATTEGAASCTTNT